MGGGQFYRFDFMSRMALTSWFHLRCVFGGSLYRPTKVYIKQTLEYYTSLGVGALAAGLNRTY